MVRTTEDKLDLEHVDLSIMPSLQCNLSCPFCMYVSGPTNDLSLDINKVGEWLPTVTWEKISSLGFYGGEPFINLDLYNVFMDLVPASIPRFIITNGSWTKRAWALSRMMKFMDGRFYKGESIRCIVSGTPSHKEHQDPLVIEKLSHVEGFTIKEGDEIHPMGRAYKGEWTCTKKCTWHPQPIRMSIFPTGDVMLSNCDGVYPILGTLSDPFEELLNVAVTIRKHGCGRHYLNINDVLKEQGLIKEEIWKRG